MRLKSALYCLALSVIVFALLLIPATAARAWGNGEGNLSLYGTHDWLLSQAVAKGGAPDWLMMNVALLATDDPDYTWPVIEADHNFHPCDSCVPYPYGNAPAMVASYFEEVKQSVAAGNRWAASVALGRLSHYFADACNPLHTDDAIREGLRHNLYEMKVDTLTKSPSMNASWVQYDGPNVVDPLSATEDAAKFAHDNYRTLIIQYTFRGYNSTVSTITQASLNLAANGLADIIFSLE